MLIAVPSDAPGGLHANISSHFGKCDFFTIVRVEEGEEKEVRVIANGEHEEGGCLTPVEMLAQEGVDTLITGGMGQRPLDGFRQAGIDVVFHGGAATVSEAIARFTGGSCEDFCDDQTCGGCGGHHHGPIVRPELEGSSTVQAGRIVALAFTLTDADGIQLESSTPAHPLTYLHGHGQLLKGLEDGLDGLIPGDEKVVKLTAAQAFGDRDEEAVFPMPREQFPPQVAVDDVLHARTPQGIVPLRVVEVGEDQVTVDANHPLAGKDIEFEVKVLAVAAAAPEELQAGRALAPI